jgi:hypothetical protein
MHNAFRECCLYCSPGLESGVARIRCPRIALKRATGSCRQWTGIGPSLFVVLAMAFAIAHPATAGVNATTVRVSPSAYAQGEMDPLALTDAPGGLVASEGTILHSPGSSLHAVVAPSVIEIEFDRPAIARGAILGVYGHAGESVSRRARSALRIQFLHERVTRPESGEETGPRSLALLELNQMRNMGESSGPAEIRQWNLYPGIDLVVYPMPGGIEYDLVVAPGADPHQIRFQVLASRAFALDEGGDLVTHAEGIELRHRAPIAYQERDGVRHVVPCRYIVAEAGHIGIALGDYDPNVPLVIDPFIAASTYLGGSGIDTIQDLVRGSDGKLYVMGTVSSTDFPGISSANVANAGQGFIHVARLRSDSLATEYVAVVGRRSADPSSTNRLENAFDDRAEAMAVANDGTVFVAAYAAPVQYPGQGGTYTRVGQKYIFKVDGSGNVSTHSGAIDPAVLSIRALAVDTQGCVYLSGFAATGLVTTAGVVVPSVASAGPYLIKLDATGKNVLYATYLSPANSRVSQADLHNGNPVDARSTAYAMVVDATGAIYLTGQAQASILPATPGSPDTTDFTRRDAFVAKLNSTASAFAFVARIGGEDADRGTSIALGPDGSIVIGGKTRGLDVLPTIVAMDMVLEHGFLAKLASDGKLLVFLAAVPAAGGNLQDVQGAFLQAPDPIKVAIDASGNIYAAGITSPADRGFGTRTPFQISPPAGGYDGFLMKVVPDASALTYSSLLGGWGDEHVTGLALDASGNAFVAGYTGSNHFPVVNAVQAGIRNIGQGNAVSSFIAKISDADAPLLLAATPSPAISGTAVQLTARFFDPAIAGSIEFRRGTTILGTATLNNGVAQLTSLLPLGIHALSAVVRGPSVWDGHTTPVIYQVVQQASGTQ